MGDSPDTPNEPKQRFNKEYEDPHFHDDEEVVPADDGERHGTRATRRKPARRIPPPRRRYED
jgi:hypothetical protein